MSCDLLFQHAGTSWGDFSLSLSCFLPSPSLQGKRSEVWKAKMQHDLANHKMHDCPPHMVPLAAIPANCWTWHLDTFRLWVDRQSFALWLCASSPSAAVPPNSKNLCIAVLFTGVEKRTFRLKACWSLLGPSPLSDRPLCTSAQGINFSLLLVNSKYFIEAW